LPEWLAGWPIFVRRGRDGALRGFHDVFRHRAGLFVGMSSGGVAHICRVPRLRCRYHGWLYDEDGRLERTPDSGDAEDFDPQSPGTLLDAGFVGTATLTFTYSEGLFNNGGPTATQGASAVSVDENSSRCSASRRAWRLGRHAAGAPRRRLSVRS
jgi:hypothetical protein